MKYELIALDLDDSLLGRDSKISATNREAVIRAQAAGLKATLATGRMVFAAMPFAKELNVTIPLITYNGGMIVEPATRRVLHHLPLSTDAAAGIVKTARELNVHINVYIGDEVFVEDMGPYAVEYSKAFRVKLNLLDNVLEKVLKGPAPTKMLAISDPERVELLKQRLMPLLGGVCALTSKSIFLELTHPGATKGKALELLAKMLHIPPERIIAVGDGFNDISMIEYAGLGVAMGNAPDGVKAASDYVTSSNIEDGVAEIIYKFVLGENM